MATKGIVLAGGKGTRLHPVTKGVSKQLLPVYDKPMIYYPLSVLMLAGIRDILVITTPEDADNYQRLLGDGSDYGVQFNYCSQERPAGLAEAFLLGAEFIGDESVCLVLGDNIFYGHNLTGLLRNVQERDRGATIFGHRVSNPEDFGVVEFDGQMKVKGIEEKPKEPKSNYAVVGLYFYDNQVIDIASKVTPSARGELEITAVNQAYVDRGELTLEILGRGFSWLDTGAHDSLISAGQFVETVEKRQGLKIGCLEEIGLTNGWLSMEEFVAAGERMKGSGYGQYILEEHRRRLEDEDLFRS